MHWQIRDLSDKHIKILFIGLFVFAFAEAFAPLLSPEDRAILDLMTSHRFRDRLRKAFLPGRWRYALPDEIAVRLAMLRGTL